MPLSEIGHLPFLFRSSLIAGLSMLEAYEGGYFGEDFQDEYLLNWRPNDVYNITSRTEPILTLEDWQGKKTNARGTVEPALYKLFGAVPIALGPAEVYDALAKGMIDMSCLEWEGQFIWRRYEVTKYRTDKVDMMIGAATHYAMSQATYDELPADIQAVFDGYAGTFLTELTSSNMDRENEWRRTMLEEYDKQVGNPAFNNLPEAERERWKETAMPVINDYLDPLEARGLPARACYDKLVELSAKYEAMYPPLGDAHLQKMLEYGYEAVYPGWPTTHPEGFEWLYEKTGTTP